VITDYATPPNGSKKTGEESETKKNEHGSVEKIEKKIVSVGHRLFSSPGHIYDLKV
jgi:hypothetical protein